MGKYHVFKVLLIYVFLPNPSTAPAPLTREITNGEELKRVDTYLKMRINGRFRHFNLALHYKDMSKILVEYILGSYQNRTKENNDKTNVYPR